ncbi:hypothetical protein [Tritonibacter litoralis]|uniref:hypothetical protein n=1 Tax=Tritonibacter litoralis TaxID=2662264 RepID=UPI0018855CEB|nr:hypothetical protein [Tritonibacter litoralis]
MGAAFYFAPAAAGSERKAPAPAGVLALWASHPLAALGVAPGTARRYTQRAWIT